MVAIWFVLWFHCDSSRIDLSVWHVYSFLRLARVEGAIAELIQELRYESESYLLQDLDSEHTHTEQ